MYPNMKTVAVACDGVVECKNREDEHWLCTNSNIFMLFSFILVTIIVFLSFLFQQSVRSTIMEHFRQKAIKEALGKTLTAGNSRDGVGISKGLILPDVLDQEYFNKNRCLIMLVSNKKKNI